MNKQSGMTLLEVLLAMSIFTAVALTLMSSMQGQRTAIERMRNETLALWIADNQLQSQDSFDEENTSSSGKELINGEEWNWRSDIHSSKDGTLKWSTKTGHRVRVFSSIDFPIRLVVTHHYIRAVLVRCNIQRYSPLLRELHR